MRLDEPSWWYRAPPPGPAALLLSPLAHLYGAIARSRYRGGKPYRSRLPVVCVGNFTAGGTGKTPLAIHICGLLRDAGHEPVLLTRGYGGGMTGPYWVDAGRNVSRDVGDEALLLARAARTMLCRDRARGARAIETGPHPATVVVMDDGLQNPQLAKDFTLALVDGGRGLGNGMVIPAGPLRAPLDFQLELADGIVVNEAVPGAGGDTADWLRHHFQGPVLRAATLPSEDAGWLAGLRVIAWAGIGAPQRFFGLLRHLGADVIDSIAFPDHGMVREADAVRLLRMADSEAATLVTTQKDRARLAGATGEVAALREASRELPVRIAFQEADAVRLASLLDAALGSPRR